MPNKKKSDNTKGERKEKPFRINGTFTDVLKVAVKDNPKPKKKKK